MLEIVLSHPFASLRRETPFQSCFVEIMTIRSRLDALSKLLQFICESSSIPAKLKAKQIELAINVARTGGLKCDPFKNYSGTLKGIYTQENSWLVLSK